MKHIAVIGGGTMGNGIAHAAAASAFDVTLVDVGQEILDRAIKTISTNLQRGVDKGKMTAGEKTAVLGRIKISSDMQAVADADIVIEAIIENLAAKTQLFATLDKLTKPECILASNTSSISITKIAAATKRPEKVIGMHFMNPVPVMALVEVIRGIATADDTYQRVEDLAKRMGKTAIEVNDYPGFISNRVLMPMINEAIFALYEGVATAGSDRRRDEARHESSDGTADARRLHRLSMSAWRSCACSRKDSAIRNTGPARCSSKWSMPDGWAGSQGRGFYRY